MTDKLAILYLKKTILLLGSRIFWTRFTLSIFFLLTMFVVHFSLGGIDNRWFYNSDGFWVNFFRCLIDIVCGLYGIFIFKHAIERQWMLFIGYFLYVLPLTLVMIVIGLNVFDSVGFILAIPGMLILWLVARWFYDSIPEE